MDIHEAIRQKWHTLRHGSWRDLPIFEAAATIAVVTLSATLVAIVLVRLVHDRSLSLRPAPEAKQGVMSAEVSLGDFEYYQPSPGKPLPSGHALQVIEFNASAVITGTEPELRRMESKMKTHQHRIRNLVDVTTRRATREELADPDLSQVRGRLKSGIAALLGGTPIDDVLFSKFRCFQVTSTP